VTLKLFGRVGKCEPTDHPSGRKWRSSASLMTPRRPESLHAEHRTGKPFFGERDSGAYATRMAQVLGILVQETAGREELEDCDLIIVGPTRIRRRLISALPAISGVVSDLEAASRIWSSPFADGSSRKALRDWR
jgi:hypothetical protein